MTGFWGSVLEERISREEAAKEALKSCTHQRCLVPEECPFDCIAITAPNPRASTAYLDELVHRVGGKGPKEVLVLAVSDPEGVRIGSGGGTLNAVLEVRGVWILSCLCWGELLGRYDMHDVPHRLHAIRYRYSSSTCK